VCLFVVCLFVGVFVVCLFVVCLFVGVFVCGCVCLWVCLFGGVFVCGVFAFFAMRLKTNCL
jgi:hypothetical protein